MIRKSTWAIVLIFAALLAVTIFWQRSQEQKEAEATPTATLARRYLFDLADQIVFVRLERVNDRVLELKQDSGGQWQFVWPAGMQVDRNALDPALTQLAVLYVLDDLEQPPALDVLGLDQPSYRLLVGLADGSQAVANVGKETPTSSGYYVLDGSRKIYVVDKINLDEILNLIDNPPVLLTPLVTEAELQLTPTP